MLIKACARLTAAPKKYRVAEMYISATIFNKSRTVKF